MLVDEKPPLDDDLLIHYGIPGMKWGQRKAYIPVGRSYGGGAAPAASSGRVRTGNTRPQQPQRRNVAPSHGMSTGKKVAVGVGVTVGVAAGAYFLSKVGTRPSAMAMTSASNRAGLRVATGILKTSGKTSIKGLQAAPKVAKVGGKVGFKTGKLVGKGIGKGSVKVAKNSSGAVKDAIEAFKNRKPSVKSAVRGEKFGKLLLGEYGPEMSVGDTATGFVTSQISARRKKKK